MLETLVQLHCLIISDSTQSTEHVIAFKSGATLLRSRNLTCLESACTVKWNRQCLLVSFEKRARQPLLLSILMYIIVVLRFGGNGEPDQASIQGPRISHLAVFG